jgi:hypothetical protein
MRALGSIGGEVSTVAIGDLVPERWDQAVAEASADQPSDLTEAVRVELVHLWTDLLHAIRFAYRGSWSVGCEDLTGRIIWLSRLVGATPWRQLPLSELLLDGIYAGIYTSAGIAFEAPTGADLERIRKWRDGQVAAARKVGSEPR